MKNTDFAKVKKNKPVSIIVHSTNVLGYSLAKILAEQGSQVILVDKFDARSKKDLLELKKIGQVDFVDMKGLEDLMQNVGKVDYLFYIQSDFLLSHDIFESKDFLEESNSLNLCLKVVQKYNAKFSLITTIAFNERLIHAMENINYSKPSPYSAEELQKYSETLVAEYHDKAKINARIVRIGTLMGSENNVQYYKQLNKLFDDSVKSSSINIEGEGLNINYLIHIEDAIYGILKLTFTNNTNGEVVSLCNNNEYTVLSIAYKLLELNPEATEIKFIPETTKKPILYTQYIPAPNAENYGWKQQKNLESSINETLTSKYKQYGKEWETANLGEASYNKKLEEIRQQKLTKKNPSVAKTSRTPMGEFFAKILKPFSMKKGPKKEKKPFKNKLKSIFTILILALVFYFLIYPFISLGISGFIIYSNTKDLRDNYSALQYDEAERKFENVNNNVINAKRSVERLEWLFTVFQAKQTYATTSTLLYAAEDISEGALELHRSIQPLLIYFNEFEPALDFQEPVSRTTREYTEILREVERNSSKVEQAIFKISRGNSAIQQTDFEIYPNFLNQYTQRILQYSETVERQILPLDQVVSFLPDVLGVNERKRYLILLQNPAELRSTGGWISSYAVIGLEGGQIRELDVDDVYNLDGELINMEKFFDAPEDMQNALDVQEWNLSLSNWSPSFPDTANNASFFVKEANVLSTVDGVIAIDIYFLQNLLNKWGGINIPGESEIITSENIYEKIFAVQQDFSPGQSQKATFLANLANETLTKLLSSNTDEYALVMNTIIDSLETKNILVSLNNNRAQQYFQAQGWTGSISPDMHSAIPFSIEWNWAANKSNLYIDREEIIWIEILNQNEIRYTYKLFLRNNSSTDTYPQGEYINYTRIYIPENANVVADSGFQNNMYDTYYENGFKVLGGWFNIPIQTTRELTVQYNLTNTENVFSAVNNEISMPINILKQPGTSTNDKIRLEIFYPEIWSIVKQEEFSKTGIQLTKELLLDTDKAYELKWRHR